MNADEQCECITDTSGECLICDDPYNEDGACDCHSRSLGEAG